MLAGFLFGVKGRTVDGRIWAVRMPGGPTKIVMAKEPLTESQVKKVYRSNTTCRAAAIDQDPDLKWPLLEAITRQTLQKDFSWCLQDHPQTGKSLYLIEVENDVSNVRGAGKQNLRSGGKSGE